MKKVIYKYLDKHSTIDGKFIKIDHINKITRKLQGYFDINGYLYLFFWAVDRVGEEIIFEFPDGSKKYYKNARLIKTMDSDGKITNHDRYKI